MTVGESAVSANRIIMNLRAGTREEAVCELVSLFCRTEERSDADDIAEAVMRRERIFPLSIVKDLTNWKFL